MNIEEWLDAIPEGAAALVFLPQGGNRVMLPHMPEADNDQPVPEHVMWALMCIALTSEPNKDLAEQLSARIHAIAEE